MYSEIDKHTIMYEVRCLTFPKPVIVLENQVCASFSQIKLPTTGTSNAFK